MDETILTRELQNELDRNEQLRAKILEASSAPPSSPPIIIDLTDSPDVIDLTSDMELSDLDSL